MTFGDELAATLADLRLLAESRMRGTCRISDLGPAVTDSGGDVTNELSPVYEGPFYGRYPGLAQERVADVAGSDVVVSRLVVRIPFPQSKLGQWFTDPPIVRPGQVVDILSDPDNPQLAGTRVRVASIDDQSQATAQRLLCEDFQAGVAS